MRQLARTLLLSLAALTSAAYGQSSSFPNKPIRIVVPFTPGSSADAASRLIGQKMGDLLGQPFVIENKPGGEGSIAFQTVMSAPADGYTLFLASNSMMSVNPIVSKTLPEPAKHLKPIGGISRGINVLVVAADSRYATLADLIAAGKQNSLSGGTYSAGYRLASEWLASMAGFKFLNVPYKGVTQVLTDTSSGQLNFAVVSLDGATPLIRAGKLRALGISGETRHPHWPDVPTIKESGFPQYVNYSWDSLYLRNETPADITSQLATALQKVGASKAMEEYSAKTGRLLMPYKPDDMRAYQHRELERFRSIAEAAGIQPE